MLDDRGPPDERGGAHAVGGLGGEGGPADGGGLEPVAAQRLQRRGIDIMAGARGGGEEAPGVHADTKIPRLVSYSIVRTTAMVWPTLTVMVGG